jgi:DNA-directed RNA polymerase subunit alpha
MYSGLSHSHIYMIPLPNPPKIIKKENNTAIFEIEGLYPGYGVTVSNSLRRILLSSLEGAAVTQVKIKGVSHEFSTIPGVLEDVVIIILNLKKLRFKFFSDESEKITLKIKGEKIVKAKDFNVSSQLEIENSDLVIANLTSKNSQLEMEALVEKGVGYQLAEQREEKKKEIGMIPIDAIFTPVKRVSSSIENMRRGKRTDFDRLTIEIETDGTISPEEAFLKACNILLDHFNLFSKALSPEPAETKVIEEKSNKKEKGSGEDNKKMNVEDLKISERTKNALLNSNLKTVAGVLRKKEEGIKNLEGLGDKAVKEIRKAVKKLGFELE